MENWVSGTLIIIINFNQSNIYKQISPFINMPKKRTSDSNKEDSNIEDALVENLIKLQKVHTDLAERFDKLSKEISNLLALFELAAKNFSKHPATKTTETDKEFLDKIDKLLEQNKTIARGLTLMEEQMREKMYHQTPKKVEGTENETPATKEYAQSKTNRPLPRF